MPFAKQENSSMVGCFMISSLFAALAIMPVTVAAPVAAPCANLSAMSKTSASTSTVWWPASTAMTLRQAGNNRAELIKALRVVPRVQREAMRFLIENMPKSDLQSIKAAYLLQNVALAFQARQSAPWKAQIPAEVFLNDVLPYAFLNEERDNSRALLRHLSLPLIAGSKTPGEAAQKINQKLFPLVKVKYSTARKKPHQNATECMASGLASCSGLSILLASACRAVGVPARVVGTPMWANGRGNHTWVEVWDKGWHFVGAAEPDPQGLDHGWFVDDAAQARANVAANAIYASNWKKTGVAFPLIWAPDDRSVNALNVTARYAKTAPVVAPDKTRLLVQMLDAAGKRIELPVVVLGADGQEIGRGTTRGESADLNSFFSVEVPRNSKGTAVFDIDGTKVRVPFETGDKPEMKLAPSFGALQGAATTLAPIAAPFKLIEYSKPIVKPLSASQQKKVEKATTAYFALSAEKRATFVFPRSLDALLLSNESGVRAAVWSAWKNASHAAAKADFDANRVRFGSYESPYLVRTVGERPSGGWPLFIAMHGGGGTAKEVNDSQWQGMFQHYKDHPELGGYKYLALRAPNDTWNGFYDDYVYPLIGNLTDNFNLFGDIDANKVYIMGYSHGGYGAFAIGPKMPDHFAAIHASAGAPTDGETTARTLRSTVFTAMVGEKDTMYDRLTRDQKFDAEVKALRGDRTDIYPIRVDVMMGFEHGNLNDRDKIVEMYQYGRNPIPNEITWLQTDNVIRDFFWLSSSNPAKEHEIDATRQGNSISITTTNGATGEVFMDARMVDFSKPIELEVDGRNSQVKVVPRLKTLCETMARRGDPELAFSAQVPLQ